MRIYLDMCCYNRPYDDQSQIQISLDTQAKLHIQDMVRNGEFDLVASYMLRYECSQNPFEMRRTNIMQFIQDYASFYVGSEHKKGIEEIAQEIMTTGIKFKDACHVASALYAECSYFVSTDKRLLKYHSDKIRMVTPASFLLEIEREEE